MTMRQSQGRAVREVGKHFAAGIFPFKNSKLRFGHMLVFTAVRATLAKARQMLHTALIPDATCLRKLRVGIDSHLNTCSAGSIRLQTLHQRIYRAPFIGSDIRAAQ